KLNKQMHRGRIRDGRCDDCDRVFVFGQFFDRLGQTAKKGVAAVLSFRRRFSDASSGFFVRPAGAALTRNRRKGGRPVNGWMRILAGCLPALLLLAAGCMYPEERRLQTDRLPEHVAMVQSAADQYWEQNRRFPIKEDPGRAKAAPYENYVVYFSRLGGSIGQMPRAPSSWEAIFFMSWWFPKTRCSSGWWV